MKTGLTKIARWIFTALTAAQKVRQTSMYWIIHGLLI